MGATKRSALLEQLGDLGDPTPKDFDPEDESPLEDEEEGSGEHDSDDVEEAARDHYVSVGKSKLRRTEQPPLGPQYAGSRVSRDIVANDEEDDPFAKGFSDESGGEASGAEEDTDDQSAGSEEDATGSTGSGAGNESGEEDIRDMEASMSSMEEDSEDEQLPIRPTSEVPKARLAELQKALALDQKTVAGSISQAAKDEAEKGRAVKKQRTTFDNLLNVRIKLQKGLIGANTLAGLAKEKRPPDQVEGIESAMQAAEDAAFNLWHNLTTLRDSLDTARTGQKRTHATFTADTDISSLWIHTQSQNTSSQAHIDATLTKWHTKTHTAEATARQSRNKFTKTAASTIHDVLDSHLSDRTRLLKRARTPRSCAPYQLAQLSTKKPRLPSPQRPTKNDDADENDSTTRIDAGDRTVYDDADFYSVLLTTLLEQRSSASASIPSGGAGRGPDVAALNGYQIRREAKTKKAVDTKASKGRKLRYTVHEKLMNFCAPEDRTTWGERQVDELFGGLLGRRVGLEEDGGEEDEVQDGEIEMGGVDGRLLFGR